MLGSSGEAGAASKMSQMYVEEDQTVLSNINNYRCIYLIEGQDLLCVCKMYYDMVVEHGQ